MDLTQTVNVNFNEKNEYVADKGSENYHYLKIEEKEKNVLFLVVAGSLLENISKGK